MALHRLVPLLLLAGLTLGIGGWAGLSAQAQGVNQPGKNQKNVPPGGKQAPPVPQPNPVIQADPGVNPHDAAQFSGIQWQRGPCLAMVGSIGQVQVPAGYKFTNAAGCQTIMSLTKNLPNPKDMGLIAPATFDPTDPRNNDWFLVFSWDDVGYVKDDEKTNLDGNAILQGLREGEVQANKDRAARGFPALKLVGWEQAPFYDEQLNMLSWATRVRNSFNGVDGGDAINYNVRALGRGGVMSVELVITPEQLPSELPKFKDIVKAYSFQPGQAYGEWRSGDKVAAYGLTALISGGAVAAAAKSGLLGKLGKFIVYIVLAVAGAIGALWKKVFGRRSSGAA